MPSPKRPPADEPKPVPAVASASSVFISYRHSENAQQAAFLEASLARLLEPEAIFRDQTAIRPGEKFPARLDTAIRGAAVVLVLIGPEWADLRDEKSGQRRIDQAGDFVRREIEIALDAKRKIVPLLLDGAAMPTGAALPRTIAALAEMQAVELPWHVPIRTIAETVQTEVQSLADEIRVPLGSQANANAAIRAMEASLHNQKLGNIKLDAAELSATLDRLSDFKRYGGAFLMADLIYAIDMIGVKAARGAARYVARSKKIASLDALIESLRERHVVLGPMMMARGWWDDPSSSRGLLDYEPKDGVAGGKVCIVSGWNARRRVFEIHTFLDVLGDRGVMSLTYKAVEQLLNLREARLIEAALMPKPHSQKALRDFESRLPRKRAAAKRPPKRTPPE